MEKALSVLIVMFGTALILLGGWATIGSIRSNGVTDYCYVEMWSPPQMAPQYQLFGHRPWRSDRNIGVYATVEEAKTKADSLGCKLNSN